MAPRQAAPPGSASSIWDHDTGGAGGPVSGDDEPARGSAAGLAGAPRQASGGPAPKQVSVAGPATSAGGQWPAPDWGGPLPQTVRLCRRLLGDVDDAFHAERGVLAVVLGVKQAGQHPEAGPDVDDLLLEGAVAQDVEEGGEAGGELGCLAVLALLQQLGDLLR